MAWNFSNDKPIFQQLVDRITMDIVSGKYKPGDKLEAVRELSVTAGVNPNTMQRAFAAVEDSGLIYTKRGDGRYVSEDGAVMEKVLNGYVSKNVEDFIGSLKAMGLSDEQIISSVKSSLQNKERG